MRFFNTAGPVCENDHYCLDPLDRLDSDEVMSLIRQKKYFVLHAPRQTGKTSCLLSLMEHVNRIGDYKCLYFNVESAQGAREDVKRGIRAIMNEIAQRAELFLNDHFVEDKWKDILDKSGEDAGLNETLTRWSAANPEPLVLLIDEIDSLVGDTLISVLRQLRAGYDKRTAKLFPYSIILCGVRDIRDYRIHSSKEKTIITGGSAFNIKAKSLRLGDFTEQEIKLLYREHTKETGQAFAEDALNLAWELTEGQPWLVNALAYEVCFDIKENRDRNKTVTAEMMARAKENLIHRRDVHIDQLADKLQEERVRRVIEPILAGENEPEKIPTDDIRYVRDLGLIRTEGQIRIANRIYQEVIPRELTFSTQLTISHQPAWYIRPDDGRLDTDKLMSAFQGFFRKHSEHWMGRFDYQEAGPQLFMQAFLQRIVNSGGRVEREYGLGMMRTDLLVTWPYSEGVQEIVVELKIRYGSLDSTIEEGAEQTRNYMDKCGTDEGHLVIFDRNPGRSWDEKVFTREKNLRGKKIQVWGM
ncbi:MAG: ATP-binding protein [Desulfobacteraceae bacterium]|nr:ATP-binding protein [Desulfobacteraceae bacterium]